MLRPRMQKVTFPARDPSGTLEAMDPSVKVDLLRALALLPFLVFVPLVMATLLTPVRVLVERRIDRKVRDRRSGL